MAGTSLSGTCAQRMHGPHTARGSVANACGSRHIRVALRAAPCRRSPWPGHATSCACDKLRVRLLPAWPGNALVLATAAVGQAAGIMLYARVAVLGAC